MFIATDRSYILPTQAALNIAKHVLVTEKAHRCRNIILVGGWGQKYNVYYSRYVVSIQMHS